MNRNDEAKTGARQTRRGIGVWILLGVMVVIGLGLLVGLLTGKPGFLFGGKLVRAERLRRKGLRYLQLRNPAAAVEQFRLALEQHPGHLDAREGLIRALAMKKDFVKALDELEIARQHGYPAAEAAFLKAEVLMRRAEHRIAAAGADVTPALCQDVLAKDIGPAIGLCEENVAQLRKPDEGYVVLGNLQTLRGRCLELRRRGLMREAETARVLKQEALRRTRWREAQAALRDTRAAAQAAAAAYRKALTLNENSREPRLALAGMLVQDFVPQPEQAIDLLKPLLARRPDDIDALRIVAHAQRLAGNPEETLRLLKEIPEERRDPVLTLIQAQALADLGRWAEVDTCLARAGAATQAHRLTAAFLRGKALLRLGRAAEAATVLQNIFRDPDIHWADARYELARALLQIGSREQALDALRRVFDDARVEEVTSREALLRQREAKYAAGLLLAKETLSSAPRQAAEYAARAVRLFPARDEALETAREAWSRVEDGQRPFSELLIAHINAVAATGRVEAAIEKCRAELTRPGAPAPALRRLMATLLLRNGSYRDAVAVYERLWNDYPDVLAYGLELGRLRAGIGQYEEALSVYEKLLQRRPANVQAAAEKAQTLLSAGKPQAASEWLRTFATRHGIGLTHDWLLHLYIVEGRRADALALARSQAEAMPKKAQPQATFGELLLREGNMAEARGYLQAALLLDPTNRNAYTLGLLELARGNTSDAVKVFDDAVQHLPDWFAARLYRAFALHADGRAQEAVSALREMLADAPPRSPAWDLPRWTLAIALAGNGDLDGARKQNAEMAGYEFGDPDDRWEFLNALAQLKAPRRAEAARQTTLLLTLCYAALEKPARQSREALDALVPGQPLPSFWLATALEKAGKPEDAEPLYEALTNHHADFLPAYMALARRRMETENYQGAIEILKHALPLTEGATAASFHAWLGKAYEESGEFDAAEANYKEALRIRPDDPVTLNNLAWLLATRKRDPAGALSYAEKAARLASNQPHILDTLGWICYLNGDIEKAVTHLERAKRSLPDVAAVRYHLGMAYMKEGRRESAKAELEEALTLSESFDEADDARRALDQLKSQGG